MVRNAIEEDSLSIYNLLRTYSENTHINVNYIENDIKNNSYSKYYVYEEHKNIIGMININIIGDYAEILDIVVDEKHRKNKVGSKLLEYVLNITNNCEITLEVRQDNIAAIKLYEKYGFKIVNKRENYYKDCSAYIMSNKEGD